MELPYKQDNYLYHGSPFKLETLCPRQAHDTQYESGCQEAVYATDNIDMAICFALGVEGDENSERTMMPEHGMKMVFKKCHPRYGQKGYIYVLNKKEFVHAMGSQWVSYNEQIPVDIIEIDVDDYADEYSIVLE